MVVADGVGGWEAHGYDSGLFSKKLVYDVQGVFNHDKTNSQKDNLILVAYI